MVLNDEQNELFFDTMDSLLYYVNDRFRVVEGFTLDYSSPIDDVKSSLVAHELWENVEIIDDFVRDNPQRLSPRCLDLARSWKNALPGFYTLVRYQSGRALLMGEAGVFSVCGVTYELEHEIGKAPAYVETVLLPFEDTVVYDGFLQAYDTDHSAAELQRIQDEFENCCAKGIALTGEDFTKRAEAFLAEHIAITGMAAVAALLLAAPNGRPIGIEQFLGLHITDEDHGIHILQQFQLSFIALGSAAEGQNEYRAIL